MGIADTLLKENSNKVEILARILPQMASAADARMVVAKLLDNNKTEIQKLRREIGFALKPMLGKFFCVFLNLCCSAAAPSCITVQRKICGLVG
jgi:hypothetical protein